MVSSIDITKVGVRGGLVIDLVVEMDNPNDYQFQPRVHLDGNVVRITNEGYADEFSNIELDDVPVPRLARTRRYIPGSDDDSGAELVRTSAAAMILRSVSTSM